MEWKPDLVTGCCRFGRQNSRGQMSGYGCAAGSAVELGGSLILFRIFHDEGESSQ